MPRIAGISMPKDRKPKASGQAIVTLSGKDHYLGSHGTVASRKEYDHLIREWDASGGALVQDRRDDITIVEIAVGVPESATSSGRSKTSRRFRTASRINCGTTPPRSTAASTGWKSPACSSAMSRI